MERERVPVVILCGGAGTRLAEQTEVRPKPLVEIGGRPILWHIMKHYSTYGFNEFVLALGYRGDQIKRYFLGYHAVWQDITVNLGDGSVLDGVMAKGRPAQLVMLKHVDKVGSRSISVQRLGDALRKRMDAAQAEA